MPVGHRNGRGVPGVVAGVDIAALVANWQQAADSFDELVARVANDDWTRATPCVEWDVRALVNHVTRGNHNYVLLLQGGGRDEFLRRRELDALGTDPAAAHQRSVALLTTAFQAPGAASRTVDHPLGAMPGSKALGVRAIDTVLHTWDLARAIGADERADDGLVRWVEEHWNEVYADVLDPTFYAAPLPAPENDDATGLVRLLHRTGRRAHARSRSAS